MNDWYTSNLPHGQTDLDKLVQWLHEHDPDWMSDALWLRYVKLSSQVYHTQDECGFAWEVREAHFDQLPFATKALQNSPFPFAILPEVPPSHEVDRLSALPHDIRVKILSYLLLPEVRDGIYCGSKVVAAHPLNRLALASKAWRVQVEAFCSHSLLVWRHEAEARCEGGDVSEWVEWRDLATYTANARMEYVFKLRKYCGVCGRPTTQFARSGWLLCCEDCEYDF